MASWGFWEWLTYGCIAIAAVMMAVDQGAQRSGSARNFLGPLIQSPLWAFTPLALILSSAVLIFGHALFAPVPDTKPTPLVSAPVPDTNLTPLVSAPAPQTKSSQAELPQVNTPAQSALTEPNNLNEQTNQDIRQYAYVVKQHLDDFLHEYYHDITILSGPADELASAKLGLDEKLNRDFREQYEQKVIRLAGELARRLKINDSRDISFSSNRINPTAINGVGYHLVTLANQLP